MLTEKQLSVKQEADFKSARESLLKEFLAADSSQALKLMEKASYLAEEKARHEQLGNSTRQRQFGIYYTSFPLAFALVEECIRLKGDTKGTFYEPCVGGGAFLIAFIDLCIGGRSCSKTELQEVLKRCYVADSDEHAIDVLKEFLPVYLQTRYGHYLNLPESNIFVGDSLIEEQNGALKIRSPQSTFNLHRPFDLIVTNPPYLSLKSDSRLGTKAALKTNQLAERLARDGLLRFGEGTRNLYKAFVEAITDHWLESDGVAGFLIPRGLLTDNNSKQLRAHMADNFQLGTIVNLEEGNEHFKSVGQAFSAFAARKGSATRELAFGKLSGDPVTFQVTSSMPLAKMRSLTPNGAFFEMSERDLERLDILSKFETISESLFISNLRGELDMTLDKRLVSAVQTEFKLVQGSSIQPFSLKESRVHVAPDILSKPKGRWVLTPRLACQQISNMNSKKRLKWALVPPGFVLANSCNFIAIDDSKLQDSDINLKFLLGVLNSDLINWHFQLFSANNHVSNKEIGRIPIGKPSSEHLERISRLAGELETENNPQTLVLLNDAVEDYFGTSLRS